MSTGRHMKFFHVSVPTAVTVFRVYQSEGWCSPMQRSHSSGNCGV